MLLLTPIVIYMTFYFNLPIWCKILAGLELIICVRSLAIGMVRELKNEK